MGLFAGDIKSDPTLTAALGQVGAGPQNDIRGVYDRIRGNFKADSKARGTGPGSYAPDRFNVAQGQSEAGLQGTLEQALGNATYKNALGERDANQNEALAREVGGLNKPSTLEEILAGLGGGAQLAGGIYGATRGRAPRYQGQGNGATPPWDIYGLDPGGYAGGL